jgi:hypothetical protein
MKPSYGICIILFLSICVNSESYSQNVDYFGQKSPGDRPEVFAPGLISTEKMELMISFSTDGNLCIFHRRPDDPSTSEVQYMIREESGWTEPEGIPFIDSENDGYFILAPGDNALYFASKRPYPGTVEKRTERKLWKMPFQNQKWQRPQLIDLLKNTSNYIGHPSFTNDGTVYFYDASETGGLDRADIFYSRFRDGKYGEIQDPGPGINTDSDECDAFIDPEEKYMLLAIKDHPECMGYDFDIFISFRKKDGGWTQAVSLGEKINSRRREIYPRVSPDGKFILFSSNRTGNWDIYWVDAEIVEEFRQ